MKKGEPYGERTFCEKRDCVLNNKGICFVVKEEAVLRNGTRHRLDLSKCPFFKFRKGKE